MSIKLKTVHILYFDWFSFNWFHVYRLFINSNEKRKSTTKKKRKKQKQTEK